MRGLTLISAIILPLAIAGCANQPSPVNRPCGVIVDPLKDVQGKTPQDVRRIDRHYERGHAAGCWQ